MTKFDLAAQKCVELAGEGGPWMARFLEHVSDLCEQAIASGNTSGLEELVLCEPVDPLEAEAAKFAESWAPEMVTPSPEIRLVNLEIMALAALRRGKELGRQESEQRGEGE